MRENLIKVIDRLKDEISTDLEELRAEYKEGEAWDLDDLAAEDFYRGQLAILGFIIPELDRLEGR